MQTKPLELPIRRPGVRCRQRQSYGPEFVRRGLTPGGTGILRHPGPIPGTCAIGDIAVFGCRPDLLRLVNPGIEQLQPNQVLVDPDDRLDSQVLTLYFHAILFAENGWEWKNQLFFESADTLAESAYGFSQLHDTWVLEEKLVVSNKFEVGGVVVLPELPRHFQGRIRYRW